jgi:hypothetical protein
LARGRGTQKWPRTIPKEPKLLCFLESNELAAVLRVASREYWSPSTSTRSSNTHTHTHTHTHTRQPQRFCSFCCVDLVLYIPRVGVQSSSLLQFSRLLTKSLFLSFLSPHTRTPIIPYRSASIARLSPPRHSAPVCIRQRALRRSPRLYNSLIRVFSTRFLRPSFLVK